MTTKYLFLMLVLSLTVGCSKDVDYKKYKNLKSENETLKTENIFLSELLNKNLPQDLCFTRDYSGEMKSTYIATKRFSDKTQIYYLNTYKDLSANKTILIWEHSRYTGLTELLSKGTMISCKTIPNVKFIELKE